MKEHTEESGKKNELLDAALELFAEHGFDGTSVRMIAEKADMNVAMISYYFGSKEKLLFEVIDRKTSYAKDRVAMLAANDELSDWGKMEALIEGYVDRITESGGKFHKLMMRELSLGARPEMAKMIGERITQNMTALRGLIEDGVKRKAFRSDIDFGMMMCVMIGTITHSIMSQRLFLMFDRKDKKPLSDAERRKRVSEHLKEVFARYLLVNPAERNSKKTKGK